MECNALKEEHSILESAVLDVKKRKIEVHVEREKLRNSVCCCFWEKCMDRRRGCGYGFCGLNKERMPEGKVGGRGWGIGSGVFDRNKLDRP